MRQIVPDLYMYLRLLPFVKNFTFSHMKHGAKTCRGWIDSFLSVRSAYFISFVTSNVYVMDFLLYRAIPHRTELTWRMLGNQTKKLYFFVLDESYKNIVDIATNFAEGCFTVWSCSVNYNLFVLFWENSQHLPTPAILVFPRNVGRFLRLVLFWTNSFIIEWGKDTRIPCEKPLLAG